MTAPRDRSLRTPTDDELPTLLAELQTSGESLAAFARSRGLTTWKLYRAQRAKRPDRFDPIRLIERPSPTAEPIELVHAAGHRIMIRPDFDSGTLQRLLEVLASC